MIEAKFHWQDAHATDGESATWGDLRIVAGVRSLWGAAGESTAKGIRWTWIDLLEFISSNWPWLVGELGWPSDILPADMNPSDFDAERRYARERAIGDRRRVVESTLFEFRERHDLSRALPGKRVPDLWIVRQGNWGWIGAAGASAHPWSEIESFLGRLGASIAERLRGHRDERAREAVNAWNTRAQVDSSLRAEVATGLARDALVALVGEADASNALELQQEGFESSELAFAAKLAAPASNVKLSRKVLRCIRQTPARGISRTLATLSEEAIERQAGESAHEEGAAVALWLRERLAIAPEVRVDPGKLLADWSVSYSETDFDSPAVDAVACWGPKHGPAVIVNISGHHSEKPAGRRAAIAHEIAHLLLDRASGLPLSEVQGVVYRSRCERRANAFAAELLVPRAVAGEALGQCKDRAATKETAARLSKTFGTSREIVAWQALNSERVQHREVLRELAEYVPSDRRRRFYL